MKTFQFALARRSAVIDDCVGRRAIWALIFATGPRSLSDLKNRSEKIAEREQNLIIFSAIVFPIAEKISELS